MHFWSAKIYQDLTSETHRWQHPENAHDSIKIRSTYLMTLRFFAPSFIPVREEMPTGCQSNLDTDLYSKATDRYLHKQKLLYSREKGIDLNEAQLNWIGDSSTRCAA